MIRLVYVQIQGLKGSARRGEGVADYNLGAPVTIATGPNGAGKTTISEAIAFLLGRRVSGIASNATNLASLLDGEAMSVSGQFLLGSGRRVVISRSRELVKGRFKRAIVHIDGQLSTDDDVLEILGDVAETSAELLVDASASRLVEVISGYATGATIDDDLRAELEQCGISASNIQVASAEVRAALASKKRDLRATQSAAEESRRWASLGEYSVDDLADAHDAVRAAVAALASYAAESSGDGLTETGMAVIESAKKLAEVSIHIDRVKRAHADEEREDRLGAELDELSDLGKRVTAAQASMLEDGLRVVAAAASRALPRTWSLDMEMDRLGLRMPGQPFVPAAGLSSAQRAILIAALDVALQTARGKRGFVVVNAEVDSLDAEHLDAFATDLERLSRDGVISQAVLTCWRTPSFSSAPDARGVHVINVGGRR
ncbi:MAG: ATP-binding protein [Gammaproteobacteria bacterium]|nr:ATP-binding protein [Gammaproteobacteria bacterium]